MEYLLGTDIGTSGTKTILMDTEGNLIAKASGGVRCADTAPFMGRAVAGCVA